MGLRYVMWQGHMGLTLGPLELSRSVIGRNHLELSRDVTSISCEIILRAAGSGFVASVMVLG